MPIGHIGLLVSNLEEAKALYLSALAPLGYETAVTFPGRVGLGAGGVPDFWLRVPGECVITGAQPHKDVHVAFAAARREVVDQVHAAAMSAFRCPRTFFLGLANARAEQGGGREG
jgi:catechol 2,3-dioxygenase-like lactoylglutathione lyase family enzyme